MGKKYDFDKLFDGARDTVEYWQERHEIAHGEMLARDAEIEALKARIAELEAGKKPFDFDALFADARQTPEYWQERYALAAERVKELEADTGLFLDSDGNLGFIGEDGEGW